VAKTSKTHPYAVLKATHSGTYGHLHLSLHGVFGDLYAPPNFVIKAQTGGAIDMSSHLYAFKYGIDPSIDPLRSAQLAVALKVMKRVEAAFLKAAAEGKREDTFPAFVLTVLHAAKVHNVHFVDGINGRYVGDETSLPAIDCFKDPVALSAKINNMANDLYARN